MSEWILQSDTLLYILKLVGFVGIGAFLDRSVALPWRLKLSGYIFGDKGVTLRQFETSIMTSLIQLLSRKDDVDRLSFVRIAIYSLVITASYCLIMIALDVRQGNRNSATQLLDGRALLILAGTSFACFLSDIASVYISKRIFYYRPAPLRLLPLRIALDAGLSLTAAALLLLIIGQLPLIGDRVEFGLLLSMASSIVLNLIQVTCLVAGVVLRIVVAVMAKEGNEESMDALRKTPFTVMFAGAAMILAFSDAII